MVKQKNHTARNKTVREHAKGIRKVPNFRYRPASKSLSRRDEARLG